MLGKTWGFDTETVLYGRPGHRGGFPYTFQLTNGKTQIYFKNPSLNPEMFRTAFFKTVDRYCSDGDVLLSFNLFFENSVLWRDNLFLFLKNRIDQTYLGGALKVTGVLEDPTPFLKLNFVGRKTIYVIDSAKFFGDGGKNTLASIAESYTDIPKLGRPSYLGERKPRVGKEENYFRRYSMVDAIITERLGEIIRRYHEEAKLSEWCFSTAHLAGTYFNRSFCEGRKLDLADGRIEGGAFWARFGGYRQIHGQPGVYKDYTHLDLDSAYPWLASKMRGYYGGRYVRSIKVPKDGEAVLKIQTILPHDDIRPLFLRRGKNNIELQPLGRPIRFWTTGYEINAYKRVFPNWKFSIMEGYEWVPGRETRKPLREWMLHHHKIKEAIPKEDEKRKWLRDFSKGMMNHLTGKFDSSIEFSKETWATSQGLVTFSETRPGMLRNFFVAALIRAGVRARVWGDGRYWEKFPVQPSLQEMTDSIDIPVSQIHRIKKGKGLGTWGEECRGDLLFVRGGTYFYIGKKWKVLKLAFHGLAIKNPRTGKFDFARLLKLILKGGGTYTRRRMVRVREALRKDGMSAESALRFEDKKFKVTFKNKLREEVQSWLKGRKIPFKSLRSV